MGKVLGLLAFTASLLTGVAAAQEADFSGVWRLNERLSQDAYGKIYLALGDHQMQGAGTGSNYNSVNRGAFLQDNDRVMLRRLLHDYVRVMDEIEIEQNQNELKIWVGSGEEFFSIFYLDGEEHTRQSADGERVQATAKWEETGALRVHQVAEGGNVLEEIFSSMADGAQLAIVFHLTSKVADGPVLFRVVYDRVEEKE